MAGSFVLKGVIFDLDGTLIDNEGVYDRAFCAVLKRRGISCEEMVHIPGIGVKENWDRMIARIGMDESAQDLARETQKFYLEHLSEVKVRFGVRELMHYLKGRRVKIILATSNTSEIGNRVVEALGLGHHFESRTFGDNVKRRKPAPDLFIKAMQDAGLDPRNTVVIEDSAAGVEAAKATGAKVIAIKTDWATRAQLFRADKIVMGFEEALEIIRSGKL